MSLDSFFGIVNYIEIAQNYAIRWPTPAAGQNPQSDRGQSSRSQAPDSEIISPA